MKKDRNNRLFLMWTLVGLASITLFMQWISITSNIGVQGIPITITGLNGSISLVNVTLNTWIFVLANIYVNIAMILHINKKASLSPVVGRVLLSVTLVYLLFGLYLGQFSEIALGIGTGLIIILSVTISNLYLLFTQK